MFFSYFILSVKGLGLFTRHSRNAGGWGDVHPRFITRHSRKAYGRNMAGNVGILGVLGILGDVHPHFATRHSRNAGGGVDICADACIRHSA